MSRILIIDGNNLMYRAYHVAKNLNTGNTNSTVGIVLTMLNSILTRYSSYEYGVVTWDVVGGDSMSEVDHRKVLSKDYKANRLPMEDDLSKHFKDIRDVFTYKGLLGLIRYGVEADDVISSITKVVSKDGVLVTILTNDKDMMQLIDDRVNLFRPCESKLYDKYEVVNKFGVEPNTLLDLFSIIGDKADNVKGLTGIGKVKGRDLLLKYGSLDGIYSNLDELSKGIRRLVEEGKEDVYLARELIRLRDDVDVPSSLDAYLKQPTDYVKLDLLLQRIGLI